MAGLAHWLLFADPCPDNCKRVLRFWQGMIWTLLLMWDVGWGVGGWRGGFAYSSRNRLHSHTSTHAHINIVPLTPLLIWNADSTIKGNASSRLSSSLSFPPSAVSLSLPFSLRPSMTAVPWSARPRHWATAGLGEYTETKEGQTTTTWSVPYLRRAGLPDTDTDEKTGVTGRLKGPSVVTLRLTQVRKTTDIIISHRFGQVPQWLDIYTATIGTTMPLKSKCILCKKLKLTEKD